MIHDKWQQVHSSVDCQPLVLLWQHRRRIKLVGAKEPSQYMLKYADGTPYAMKVACAVQAHYTPRTKREDENGPTTPNEAPSVVGETTELVASAVIGTIADLGEVISNGAGGSIILIEDAKEGAVYTVTINGTEYESFVEEGSTAINFDGLAPEAVTATAEVTVKENRISVSGNTVNITLYDTDDLAVLKAAAKGQLTENATATITLTDGSKVTTSLTAANAVEEVLAFLESKNQTAASLKGKTFTVTLADTIDSSKTTTYTLVF